MLARFFLKILYEVVLDIFGACLGFRLTVLTIIEEASLSSAKLEETRAVQLRNASVVARVSRPIAC